MDGGCYLTLISRSDARDLRSFPTFAVVVCFWCWYHRGVDIRQESVEEKIKIKIHITFAFISSLNSITFKGSTSFFMSLRGRCDTLNASKAGEILRWLAGAESDNQGKLNSCEETRHISECDMRKAWKSQWEFQWTCELRSRRECEWAEISFS